MLELSVYMTMISNFLASQGPFNGFLYFAAT